MNLLTYRVWCLLGFAACVGGMGFALWMQHKGFEPCAMCIFQRVAMISCGAMFLLGGLFGPRGNLLRWLWSGLAALAALIGAGIAGRQVWLQHLPPDQVPACGPTLDYLRELFPITEVVKIVLAGDGNCAKIDAQWLGFTLPEWTMVAFIGLMIWAVLSVVAARRNA